MSGNSYCIKIHNIQRKEDAEDNVTEKGNAVSDAEKAITDPCGMLRLEEHICGKG